MKVSVVIPLFNEEPLIPEIASRFARLVEKRPESVEYELIFVDDGSSDRTLVRIEEEARRLRFSCTLVSFRKNFGHHHAIYAGIEQSTGDRIVLIDGDLQDPPELIPDLVETLGQGSFDLVYARRLSRQDGAMKRFFSNAFYKLFNAFSSTKIPEDTGIYRCLTAEVRNLVLGFPENDKFLLGLMEYPGVKTGFVDYQRDERVLGTSKYTLWKSLQLAWSGLTSFTTLPLTLIKSAGYGLLVLAVAGFVFLFFRFGVQGVPISGWSILLVVVCMLFSLNFLVLGIMGEYVGKTIKETKRRPNFYIRSIKKVNGTQK